LNFTAVTDVTLNVNVDTLTAHLTGTGDIDITEADDITVLGLTNDTADDSNPATGTIRLESPGGTITVAAAGTGVITLDGDITLIAGGTDADVVVEQAISTGTTGSVTITADDSVTFTGAGDVTATGTGDVTVTANADDAAGNSGNVITLADATLINAGSGFITLTTAGAVNGLGGGITLGGLLTTNAADTAVSLTTDADVIDGGDSLMDVMAASGRLVISAGTGIGVAGALGALETTVASADIANTTSGGIDVLEADDLTLVALANAAVGGSIVIRTTDGSLFLDAAIPISTDTGNVTLDTNGAGRGIVLMQTTTLTTGAGTAGDIRFADSTPIDSDTGTQYDLTLTAGTGSVFFNDEIGASESIGALTITQADGGVTFGETTPVTVINTDGGIDIGTGSDVIGGTGIVLNGGAGTLTITTTDDDIRFNGPLTLAADVTIDTDDELGSILFTQFTSLDSETGEANDLMITAGTGSVSFNAAIGGSIGGALGSLTVTDAEGVTLGGADTPDVDGDLASVTVVTVTSGIDLGSVSAIGAGGIVFNGGDDGNDLTTEPPIAISTATGGLRFNGPVTLATDTVMTAGAGDIDFTNDSPVDSQDGEFNSLTLTAASGAVRFNEDIGADQDLNELTVTVAGGGVIFGGSDTEVPGSGTTGPVNTVNTRGTVDIGIGTNFIGGAGIVLNGGPDVIAITATGADMRFNGVVTLQSDTAISTGDTAGDITFTNDSPVDSQAAEFNSLTLTAGTGTVRFNENIGEGQPLNALTVTRADGGVIFGESDSETPGSGTTGPVSVVATNGAIDIGSGTNVVDGGIVLNAGAGTFAITTTGDDVRFNGAVVLDTDVAITTGNATAGDILFTNDSPVDSRAGEFNSLTLTAGTGTVRFNENLGEFDALEALDVTRADGGVIFGESDTEVPGSGTTGPVNIINTQGAIDIGTGSAITGGVVLNGGATGDSANASGTVDPDGDNNALVLVANTAGAAFENTDIVFVLDGTHGAETAAYDAGTNVLTVHGAADSTANQVIEAINNDGNFTAYLQNTDNDPDNDGTGTYPAGTLPM
jgi:hypothetical protein